MKRWLFTALSFAAVVFVSVYAVRRSAPHGVNFALPWRAHAIAFAAFLIEVASRCFKLTWSAKAVGARLPFWTSARVCLGGDFGASITPARAGAEPARFLILREAGVSVPTAMVVMYTELLFEMLSLAIVIGALLLFFDTSHTVRLMMGTLVGAYSTAIVATGAIGYMLSRRELGDTPPMWALRLRLTGRRWEFVRRWVDRIRGTVDAFRKMHLGWGAASLSASVVHVGVRFIILPVIVNAMTTATVALAPLVVWGFAMVYGAGLMPAPGGGGAVEFTFHTALGNTIPAEAFASSLLWWRFYTFYLYIAFGALVAGNTVLRAIREAEKEVEDELEQP